MATVILDAGHGGSDFGATYQGRMEKDDTLRLTLAIGEILQNAGVNVLYTRTEDIYETPAQKAAEGNASGADYFVSIHRNSSPRNNQYTGIESLVYNRYGAASHMAENINTQLERVGFVNHGIALNGTQEQIFIVVFGLAERISVRCKVTDSINKTVAVFTNICKIRSIPIPLLHIFQQL